MSPGGEPDAEKLEQLLGDWVEQRIVHGVTAEPEALCRDHPELLEPLRECIREYQQLNQALTPRQGLAPGLTLLHYRIVEQLGAGGMGEVYLAEDQKLGRRVALKVLPAELAGDPQRLRRFRREARAVAALNHPNIITLHSIEEAEGTHFLTMELVAGTTLSDRIPPHGVPLSRLFNLAIPVADALAAAHERDITHRDLKPDNVMVDAKGRVKILDFGLAKQRHGADAAADDDDAPTLTATLTQAGHIVGTMPYMSPEQLEGKPADVRSDIFSLGVMLYQMATGRRPFQGEGPAQLISSILRDTPASVDELRQALPRHLGRIVRHCLEKDPEHRYQSALDVRNELADLKREVATGEVTTGTAAARRRPGVKKKWLVAVGAAAILALVAGYFQLQSRQEISVETPAPNAAQAAATDSARPSVAVLYFQNITADPELDWLRGGITTMLVTALSQSPDLDILNPGRTYQILTDLDALDESILSYDLVRGFAERAAVDTVLRGSYARVGEVLRVAFTIEDATNGEILKTYSVEERGEERLFAMVDELSAAVRNHFEVDRQAESPTSVQATTSSFEAWRLYTEGIALSYQSKHSEAIDFLEKAVDIDPTFALALANLGMFHENLGHTAQSREYKRRAFELADRLPLNQRYRIKGKFYSTWTTLGRGIEAYRQGLRLNPDRRENWEWRGALAWNYAYLERYEEAIEELSEPIASGATYPGYYTLAADIHAAVGRFETGYRILEDFSSRSPDNWSAQLKLGWLLTEWGKLEEAAGHLERAAELRPGDYNVPYARWRLHVRRGDWDRAEVEADVMAGSRDPLGRWRGALSQARNLTYRGRTEEALIHFDKAADALPTPDAFTALARCWKAELLLQRGEAARALAEAKRAQDEGQEEFPELKGLFLAALAEQRLGRTAEAEAIERTLWQKRESHPNRIEERQLHHLAGLLALDRGDAEVAARALALAESLLPAKGIEIHWHTFPEHVPIWYALGRAELAAGREQEALHWFERVASSSEHVEQPVPYVRSFYFLGRIYQRGGATDEARCGFKRFLHHWQGGDLDRERVEETLAGY